MSYLLDMPDAVTIQYQSVPGIQNVSLQVSLPTCQNIKDETVIQAQTSGSKEGQEIGEQIPERSYVGYYEGTTGLFEGPVEVIPSKRRNTEGMVAPMAWPPSLVYGITPSESSKDDKHQQKQSEKQPIDEKKDVEVSLAEFTETILGDSVVQVLPVAESDKTKEKIQTPLEGKEFTAPTAESTREEKLWLTPSYEKRKAREKNQYQVSKDILSETIDEEAKMISIEVQKAMEEKFKAEQEAIQLKLQQEKLQREQKELARKQAEELLVKEQ